MYDHTLHHRKKTFLPLHFYKLQVQKKYQNVMLKTDLKFMANKELQCLKNASGINSKIMAEKQSHHL